MCIVFFRLQSNLNHNKFQLVNSYDKNFISIFICLECLEHGPGPNGRKQWTAMIGKIERVMQFVWRHRERERVREGRKIKQNKNSGSGIVVVFGGGVCCAPSTCTRTDECVIFIEFVVSAMYILPFFVFTHK